MAGEQQTQVERTALAWQRTALAVGLNAALVLRLAAERDRAWLWGAGVALGLASLVIGLAASRRYRRLRGRPAPALLAVRRVGPALVLLVVAVSVVGTAAALT